jgi:uncharacterized membrane protein YbhN (UPF0104 family)
MSISKERIRHALTAVLGLLLFFIALEVLRRQLHAVTWRSLSTDALNTPPMQLLAAAILAAMNYAVLTGYDFIAFSYIGRKLPRWRVAVASFIAYSISNNRVQRSVRHLGAISFLLALGCQRGRAVADRVFQYDDILDRPHGTWRNE